ncbi:MAG: histidinol-phosphate transaminase [Candidatus Nanopelagicales bacterium]
MPPRQRPVMSTLPAYKAGQRADPGGFKVSSNENPYGPLPSVLDAIAESAQRINRYPDPHSVELTGAIADRLGVSPEWVAVGCGSVAVCEQVVSAVAGHGDEVVFSWPSFEAYPIITGVAGAQMVAVPLDAGFRQDVRAIAAAVTDATRCVFVCTPNNPTGTIVSHDAVTELIAAVPDDVLVVIDEAYAEFVDDPEAVDGLALLRDHPHVAVLRTFSKAYGLAGLRVGYAVAHPETAEAFRKTAIPFGVSTIAQDAAVASLAAEDELFERVAALRAERGRVLAELAGTRWRLPDPQGNFLWLPTGEQTADVLAALAAVGLVARGFAGVGIRVTIAEPAANDLLIDALTAFQPPEPSSGPPSAAP